MTKAMATQPDAVSGKETQAVKSPGTTGIIGAVDISPYKILTKFLTFPDESQKRWWEDSGSLLSRFLQAVHYDVHDQYSILLFLYKHLIPFVGPYPQRRKYMFIPYGAPIEYSINFQEKKKDLLRIALEPVSALYGTKDDPYNLESVANFESTLGQISPKNYNRDLYKRFTEEFLLSKEEAEELYQREAASDPEATMATVVWGFNLKAGGDVTIKGYINTIPKSQATGVPGRERLNKSLQELDRLVDYSGSLKLVQEYMMEGSLHTGKLPIAWDYGPPDTSRIKLFGDATKNVTPATIQEVWTLGGRINTETSRKGLELAMKLWELLNMQTHFNSEEEKPKNPVFALGWHYEIWPGSQYPVPKIYFPTVGESDEKVAVAISKFFYSLGWKERAESYPKILKAIYPNVDLSQSSRLQVWISFSYTEQGGAYSTVYYQSAMHSAEFKQFK